MDNSIKEDVDNLKDDFVDQDVYELIKPSQHGLDSVRTELNDMQMAPFSSKPSSVMQSARDDPQAFAVTYESVNKGEKPEAIHTLNFGSGFQLKTNLLEKHHLLNKPKLFTDAKSIYGNEPRANINTTKTTGLEGLKSKSTLQSGLQLKNPIAKPELNLSKNLSNNFGLKLNKGLKIAKNVLSPRNQRLDNSFAAAAMSPKNSKFNTAQKAYEDDGNRNASKEAFHIDQISTQQLEKELYKQNKQASSVNM